MIQSDATEKPIDRARGGIARLSAAKMPGARIAPRPVIAKLTTIVTQRLGTARRRTSADAHDERDVREELEDRRRAALGHHASARCGRR